MIVCFHSPAILSYLLHFFSYHSKIIGAIYKIDLVGVYFMLFTCFYPPTVSNFFSFSLQVHRSACPNVAIPRTTMRGKSSRNIEGCQYVFFNPSLICVHQFVITVDNNEKGKKTEGLSLLCPPCPALPCPRNSDSPPATLRWKDGWMEKERGKEAQETA